MQRNKQEPTWTLDDLKQQALKEARWAVQYDTDDSRWQPSHDGGELRKSGATTWSQRWQPIDKAVGERLVAAWKKNQYGSIVGFRTILSMLRLIGEEDAALRKAVHDAKKHARERQERMQEIDRHRNLSDWAYSQLASAEYWATHESLSDELKAVANRVHIALQTLVANTPYPETFTKPGARVNHTTDQTLFSGVVLGQKGRRVRVDFGHQVAEVDVATLQERRD